MAGLRCHVDCRVPTGNQAHCSVCHQSFSGVGFFDAHRRNGTCLDPRDLDLVQMDWLWSSREGHAARAASVDRMAHARATRENRLS
jgi:hypothetical protein